MNRIRIFRRLLVAALAVLALAATPALAAPLGPVFAAPAAHADHVPAVPLGVSGPVYWSYDYEAQKPQPAHAALSLSTDDGETPWTAIAAGLGGAVLLLGAGTAMTGRLRPRTST